MDPGLKLMRLHPDIFQVDFMTMEQMTEKRLAKNHLTFNFWGDMSIALMNGKPALARHIKKNAETLRVGNHDCGHYKS